MRGDSWRIIGQLEVIDAPEGNSEHDSDGGDAIVVLINGHSK
jgi:hypothetical protein